MFFKSNRSFVRKIAGSLNARLRNISSSNVSVFRHHVNTGKHSWTTVMAAITGTSMVAVGTCICDDKSSSKPLSLAEFTKRLRGPIDKIRKKVNRRTPTLEATVKGTTHELTLSTDVDVDEMSLLIFWSQVLSGEVSITTENRGGVRVHSLVAGDRRSSLVLNRSGSVCTASLFKEDGFTRDDVEYIVKGFDSAVSAPPAAPPAGRLSVDGFNDIFSQQFSVPFRGPGEESLESKGSSAPGSDPIKTLASLGVTVFDRQTGGPDAALDWDCLAGYSAIKDLIEETVVLAVTHPEVFDSVARSTRVVFESNRPKAVLLEGPPGTGKTLTARILARRCDRPLVHLKLESIVNKWYGESEKKLAQIFDACDQLEGAVVFLDEVDALATSRDSGNMHEATRRILSVILQRAEGFEGKGKSLLVCATNRKQDLDSALLSRFDVCIRYDLPDADTRKQILARYAKHFNKEKKLLEEMVSLSDGMSCRDMKEACQQAERSWAARKARGEKLGDAPAAEVYKQSFQRRREAVMLAPERTFSA